MKSESTECDKDIAVTELCHITSGFNFMRVFGLIYESYLPPLDTL